MQLCNTAEYRRAYYRKRRDTLLALLGGRCAICGSTEKLEIDHLDPSTKSFNLSDMLLHASMNRLKAEIEKCQLLCRKCHNEKSKTDISNLLSGPKNPLYKKCGKDSKSSKAVIDLDTGEEFVSATDYAEKHGLHKNSVARACRGVQKELKGHHIIYKHKLSGAVPELVKGPVR